jgi:TetR/AcrR family transcriptional regulator
MDNRAAILNCALELFAARGYDAVGVQEIAEAAGITKPTLYHYFGSKQGLLKTLVDGCAGPFYRAESQAAEYHGDLPGTLIALGRAYFKFALENPVYCRLQLAFYFAPNHSEAYQAVAGQNERQYQLVADVFEAAVVQHGNMRGRQRLYAATFIGMLNTCIGMWLNGYGPLDEDLVQRVVKQFQHGIYS